MNIAVIFTKGVDEGGAFQYAITTSLLLEKNKSSKYVFIYFTTVKKNLDVLKKYNISAIYLPWSNLDRFKSLLLGSQLVGNILTKINKKLELKLDRLFDRHKIDLVYFLSPTDMSMAVNCYNYIFTAWDLRFLDCMEFPEVYINRQFERIDRLYRLAMSKAVAVITESEFTKRNIVKRYAVAEERIISLSLLPSNAANISEQAYDSDAIDISKKYNINGRYVFYPAQFWSHKNHIYILEGLKLLKEKYKVKIHAVFAGSDKGNLPLILKKARNLDIADQVHYIGFVEDRELPYLYMQALALVMPTYFGPTNIPPLEAFKLGCPVLYSDLPNLRDQVKDAVIWLDLKNAETMCKGLLKVIENTAEVKMLVENGKKKIEFLERENRWEKLKNIFDDYAVKLKCWR